MNKRKEKCGKLLCSPVHLSWKPRSCESSFVLSWIDSSRISRSPSSVGNLSRSSAPLDAFWQSLTNFWIIVSVLHHPRVLATQHEDVHRPAHAELLANSIHCIWDTAWRRSRLSRIRVRCHAHSTVLLLHWCSVPRRCCCRHCELVFHVLPTILIFRYLDPFITLYLSKLLVSSSVLSSLRKSLNSSSHLFFGLPTALYVLYFVLSSGFHPAAFITHPSSSKDEILIATLHFILLCVLIQHGIWAAYHPFNCCSCASFHVLNPIIFFNRQVCQFVHLYLS